MKVRFEASALMPVPRTWSQGWA